MTVPKIMQTGSHGDQTLIATLLGHVNRWRKSQDWSRETMAQVIVEAHNAIGGPSITGIHFDGSHPDIYTRQKNAADRIYRWLDDASKDNNLLPANFIPSILAAMPVDVRIAAINDMLRSVAVTASPVIVRTETLEAGQMLKKLLKEQNEAVISMTDLLDGATYDELVQASKEVGDLVNVAVDIHARITSTMLKMREK